jgi:hypothetical protein
LSYQKRSRRSGSGDEPPITRSPPCNGTTPIDPPHWSLAQVTLQRLRPYSLPAPPVVLVLVFLPQTGTPGLRRSVPVPAPVPSVAVPPPEWIFPGMCKMVVETQAMALATSKAYIRYKSQSDALLDFAVLAAHAVPALRNDAALLTDLMPKRFPPLAQPSRARPADAAPSSCPVSAAFASARGG